MAVRIAGVAYLGEAHLRAGELADALRCDQEALDLSRAHRQRGIEAEALRIIGGIRSLQNSDHIGTAETLYYESIELAEPRGMRPVVAHCHLGLGKLYRRTGKRAGGAAAPDNGHHDVPRDGYELLAGASREREYCKELV